MIGWHDRRGQHGHVLGRMCLYTPQRLSGMTDKVMHDCVLGRMCRYAPIQKYDLLRKQAGNV